ncbi:hypothetical protein KUA25_06095 [Bacteroidales bacterium MSK.15.36]|nr:hypothetical protein [Bacteroidales bacterium MSK.15.36]
METGQIMMFAIQTVTTIIVGLVGWSIRSTLTELKNGIAKNSSDIEKNDLKHTAAVEQVKKEISNLKSDLPLVYTLREDYIRCQQNQEKKMNSIEDKLDKLLQRN